MTSRFSSRSGVIASVALFALLTAACSSASGGNAAPTASAAVATPTHDHAAIQNPIASASASPIEASGGYPIATVTTAPSAAPAAPAATSQPASSAAPAATVTAGAPAPTTAPTIQPQSGPIAVTLSDIAIKLDRSSTAAGKVTFSVKNAGTVIHQLIVLKTDLPQNQIPVDSSQPGKVTEPGLVAQTPTLSPGASATLSLTLGTGNYVLMCNEPAHYLIGMHIGFTIY